MDDTLQLKLMVVGQENVGKTSLIEGIKTIISEGPKKYKKSMKDNGYMNNGTTDGVSIKLFGFETEDKTKIALKIWDFAGYEHYHSTHAFFLTERSIYVIVWNINAEPENSRVNYWMKTIKFHAPNSPILLVGTHLDAVKKKKKEKVRFIRDKTLLKYQKRFPQFVDTYGVSVSTGVGMKELVRGLINLIKAQDYLKEPIPSKYLELEKGIMAVREYKHELWETSAPVIGWNTVSLIADQCGVKPDQRVNAVKFLEEMGSLVYCRGKESQKKNEDDLKEPGFVILDPQWVTQMFATVVTKRTDYVNNGVLTMEVLHTRVWVPPFVPEAIHEQLLRVLEAFEVIFPFPHGQSILIPSLLEDNLPNFQSIWPAHNPNTIQFHRYYDFSFVPDGLFCRFMVRLFSLPYKKQYWASGIILDDQQSLCLVEYKSSLSRISISARAQIKKENPVVLFVTILEFLDALLHHIFNTKARVSVPCPTCLAAQIAGPTIFTFEECSAAAARKEKTVTCARDPEDPHLIPMYHLAPDLAMIDFESQSIDISKAVTIEKVVGEGAFATVSKGEFDGDTVAVKILKVNSDTSENAGLAALHEFQREVRVMSRLQHPNLVKLLGFSLTEPMGMVMEFLEFGDLYSYLHDKEKTMDWPLRIRIALDVATGMSFLHGIQPPLCHRDLKSPNIMLASIDNNAPAVAKVADFGLSRELLTEHFKGQSAIDRDVGNPTWLAPEILRGDPSGKEADVYAYGIILWEILTRQHPYDEYEFVVDQEKAIIAGKRPEIPLDCHHTYKRLIEKCWDDDAESRPEFAHIVNNLIPIIVEDVAPKLRQALKDLSERSTAFGGRLRKSSIKELPPIGDNAGTGGLRRRRSNNKMVPDIRFAPTVTGFKPKTSISIINRWMPGAKVEEVKKTKNKAKTLTKIVDGLVTCPFPDQMTDTEWYSFSETLSNEYRDRYKIFNLSGLKYDYGMFDGVVVEYPMDPSDPPPMKFLLEAVQDVSAWISSQEGHIALIHCAGKSPCRTGVLTAGALLKLKKELNPKNALEVVSKAVGSSTFSPSQQRYITYLGSSIVRGLPMEETKLYLHKMRFTSIPSFKLTGGCDPYYAIHQNGKKVYYSKKLKGRTGQMGVEFFCKDVLVSGDIKIEFYHKDYSKQMFSLQLNSSFENLPEDNKIVLTRSQLDKASDDHNKKHFSNDFTLEIFFLRYDQIKVTREISLKTAGSEVIKKLKKLGEPISQITPTILRKKPSEKERRANFFGQPKTTEVADSDNPICVTCKLPVKSDQVSMEIMVGVTVHFNCMACFVCGKNLANNSIQSVVKGGKMLCSSCDIDFFPNCHACNKRIKNNIETAESFNFHPECFECKRCGNTLKGKEHVVKSTDVYCNLCAPLILEPGEKPREKTVQELDLQVLLKDQLGKDFFLRILENNHDKASLELWILINERKTQIIKTRIKTADEIEMKYLEPSNILPKEVREEVRPLPKDRSSIKCFDQIEDVIFSYMASKHYPVFVKSEHYAEYVEAVRNAPDKEAKQETLRRAVAEVFVPINPSDLLPNELADFNNAKNKNNERKLRKVQIKESIKSVKVASKKLENHVEIANKNTKRILDYFDNAKRIFDLGVIAFDNAQASNEVEVAIEMKKKVLDSAQQIKEIVEKTKSIIEIPIKELEGAKDALDIYTQNEHYVPKVIQPLRKKASEKTQNVEVLVNTSLENYNKILELNDKIQDKALKIANIDQRLAQILRARDRANMAVDDLNNALATSIRASNIAQDLRLFGENSLVKLKQFLKDIEEEKDEISDVIAKTEEEVQLVSEKVSKAAAVSVVGNNSLATSQVVIATIRESCSVSGSSLEDKLAASLEKADKLSQNITQMQRDIERLNLVDEIVQETAENVKLATQELSNLKMIRESKVIAEEALLSAKKAEELSRIAKETSHKSDTVLIASTTARKAASSALKASEVAEQAAIRAAEAARTIVGLKISVEIESQIQKLAEQTELNAREARAIAQKAIKDANSAIATAQKHRAEEEARKEQEAMEKMLSMLPTCAGCKLKVLAGQPYVQHPPHTFHTKCFCCKKCSINLQNEQIVLVDDEWWCVPCFSKYKALTCAVCSKAILDDNFSQYEGKNYHLACLQCSGCYRSLQSLQVVTIQGHPYCLACASTKR